jgi:CARDB protein
MLFRRVMRSGRLIAGIAAACALVPATSAHAATTRLEVRHCEAGDSAKHRAATFYGRMYAVKGTRRMAMRFTLIDRSGAGKPTVVNDPALSRWRKSRRGVSRFGFAQSVKGLKPGGVYAVQVRFRWLGAHGKVIRTEKRTSGSCRQQGDLPNLSVTGVSAQAGEASGTELYSVDVTNSGRGDASRVNVNLFVDGAAADSRQLSQVKAGETVTVQFTAPPCESTVRVFVDKGNKINETNEDDNVRRLRCPPLS